MCSEKWITEPLYKGRFSCKNIIKPLQKNENGTLEQYLYKKFNDNESHEEIGNESDTSSKIMKIIMI